MKKGDDHSHLVDGYCSGSLSDEEFAQLEELLRRNPELRRDLLESRMLESELRQFAWTLDQEDQNSETLAGTKQAFLGLRAEIWAAAAAIALMFMGAKALFPKKATSQDDPIVEVIEAEVPLDRGVAVLAREYSANWAKHTPRPGDSMPPGTWNLVSGTAEIQFYSGASVTLQAPAELEILSENGGVLHQGKLRADVPPHAHGFSIKTATIELIDLGTSFGMSVGDDSETEVHVFDGEVELFGRGKQPKAGEGNLLAAGEGRIFRNDGEDFSLQVAPSLFQGAVQLDEQSQKEFSQWLERSAKWDQDRHLIARYDFEVNHGSRRSLGAGSALFPTKILDGVIIGAQWGEGRWSGKGALDFKRPSDRVRINVPGKSKSLTMIASLRIDGLDNHYNSILLSDGWDRPGALHWQLLKNESIELAVFHGEGANPGFQSRVPFAHEPSDLGRWMQFAVSIDSDRGVITHYQAGTVIGETPFEFKTPIDIGFAEIGNWTPPTNQAREIRNFNGRIDEVLIFDEVLSPAQVASFYGGARIDPAEIAVNDGISKIVAPNLVAAGKKVAVSVGYSASEEREIELSLTLDTPPWTNFGTTRVNVPAGAGTVVMEIPVAPLTPAGENRYKFDASIIPLGGDFNQRIDSLAKYGISSTAGDR